jgi:hypothetical protein
LTHHSDRLTLAGIDRAGGVYDGTDEGSSKYQVVVPKDVRKTAGIRVAQEFQVIAKGGQITLVPDRPISSMRGFVRGMKTTGFREKKDRF